ncbi:MAG: outer membrane beta-barrel protein, partial [Candidatus Devosia euplotis]|nr:outer membrane beta-barrel protein [Candidatus Devosia euplotis]
MAGTPGVASNIATAPQTISGGGNLGIARQFGKFNVGVTAAVNRSIYGTITLTSGNAVDNSDQNAWALDVGLRVGFQLTPIVEVFGKAGLGFDIFDQQSSTLG